jgi:hypothetical protein
MPRTKRGPASARQQAWSAGEQRIKEKTKGPAKFSTLVEAEGLTGKEELWIHNKKLVAFAKKFRDRLFIDEWFLSALKLRPDLTCGGRFPDWSEEDVPAELQYVTHFPKELKL